MNTKIEKKICNSIWNSKLVSDISIANVRPGVGNLQLLSPYSAALRGLGK